MHSTFKLDEVTVETVNGLSALILQSAKIESDEAVSPGSHGADQMDHKLAFFRERKLRLRKLREEFEDVMAQSSAYPT